MGRFFQVSIAFMAISAAYFYEYKSNFRLYSFLDFMMALLLVLSIIILMLFAFLDIYREPSKRKIVENILIKTIIAVLIYLTILNLGAILLFIIIKNVLEIVFGDVYDFTILSLAVSFISLGILHARYDILRRYYNYFLNL